MNFSANDSLNSTTGKYCISVKNDLAEPPASIIDDLHIKQPWLSRCVHCYPETRRKMPKMAWDDNTFKCYLIVNDTSNVIVTYARNDATCEREPLPNCHGCSLHAQLIFGVRPNSTPLEQTMSQNWAQIEPFASFSVVCESSDYSKLLLFRILLSF